MATIDKIKIKDISIVREWVNIISESGIKYAGNSTYERCEAMKEWKEGDEVEVSVTAKGDKNYISIPKPASANGKSFPVKDTKFDKCNASLTHAISSIKLSGTEVSSDNILALADKYYAWFMNK